MGTAHNQFMKHYVLNEQGEPRAVETLLEWGEWFENYDSQRIVKQEQRGRYYVSTIFLGIDHGWRHPRPVLWETVVFNHKGHSVRMKRCGGTREQAEAMHAAMIKKLGNL